MATPWKETESLINSGNGQNSSAPNNGDVVNRQTAAEIAAERILKGIVAPRTQENPTTNIPGENVVPVPPRRGQSSIEIIKEVIVRGALTASLALGSVVGGILILRGSTSQENPEISSPATHLSSKETTLSPYDGVILSSAEGETLPQLKAATQEAIEPKPLPTTEPNSESNPVEIQTPISPPVKEENSSPFKTQSMAQELAFQELAFQELTAQELIESLFAEDFYAKNGKLQPQLIEKIEYLREKNPQMAGDLTNLVFNLLIKISQEISQEGIDDQQLMLCQRMKDLIIALTGYNPALAQALENYLDYLKSLLPEKATQKPKTYPESTTSKAPITNQQPETSPRQNTQEGEKPSTAENPQSQMQNQEKTQGQNAESQIFPRSDDNQNKELPGGKIVWSSELSRRFLNNILGNEILGITDKIPPGKYTITEIENIDFFGFPVELIHARDQNGNEISFLILINLPGKKLERGSVVSAYGFLEESYK
jgi:hypothetical protein